MDWSTWGLRETPFPRLPTGAACYWSPEYEEVLLRLEYLATRGGTALVQGPHGSGKTTLLRALRQRLQRRHHACLHISLAGLDGHEVATQIVSAAQFGLISESTPGHIWSRVNDYLLGLAAVNRPLVVLADDAGQWGFGLEQAFERLSSLGDSAGLRVCFVFAAEHARVREPAPDLLAQTDMTMSLPGWAHHEVAEYIEQSCQSAGGTRRLFTVEAVTAIFDCTAGVPGSVSRLCDLALHAAALDGSEVVDLETVFAASGELHPQPL